ncbi:lasso peptide biosynthesis protein [Spirillospora sp. CA-253888]
MRGAGATAVDWEMFLCDLDPATEPPRLPVSLRVYAAGRTAQALWTYRRRGWPTARERLSRLRPGPGSAVCAGLAPATALRLARREIFHCQLVARVLMPSALCLPRSFALAAHLRALGLPAQVTLARARTNAVPLNTFHSWTELYGVVVNDNPDVQLGYSVLQRFPAGGPR